MSYPPNLPDHLTKVKSHADASARIAELRFALSEGRKAWDTANAEIAMAISNNEGFATGRCQSNANRSPADAALS